MSHQWLQDVPLEMRVMVYQYFFTDLKVSNRSRHTLEGDLTFAPLNLLLTAKQVKFEAEPIFRTLAHFTFSLSKLYSQTITLFPGQFRGIQSLDITDGFASEVFDYNDVIDYVLDLTNPNANTKMAHLTISGDFLELDMDDAGMLLNRMLGRVKYFHVSLNVTDYIETLFFSGWNFTEGYSGDDSCKITVNDYNHLTVYPEEDELVMAVLSMLGKAVSPDRYEVDSTYNSDLDDDLYWLGRRDQASRPVPVYESDSEPESEPESKSVSELEVKVGSDSDGEIATEP